MKNVTTLDLGNGKTPEIELMGVLRGGEQLLIAVYDERPLSAIAAEFEGCSVLTKQNKSRPNVKEVYEGYTRLVSIQRYAPGDMVRITLARP